MLRVYGEQGTAYDIVVDDIADIIPKIGGTLIMLKSQPCIFTTKSFREIEARYIDSLRNQWYEEPLHCECDYSHHIRLMGDV
jgi:hypothetical protein